jgi:hypothetical protein
MISRRHRRVDPTHLKRYHDDPVAFIDECLINPETGKPFVLLDAEIAFLRLAFRLGPNGRLLHSELIYSAIKKSGKTVFGAIFLITAVVLFGERFAEAYCVANDFEQAQGRVFEIVKRIIQASPLLRREAKIGADKIMFTATGASIMALASNYASAAGGHPTIAVFDELWGYVSERSHRLWDELVPVPTRKISCRLVVSHAGFAGESVLLEELYKRGLTLPQVGTDLYAGDGMLMFWSHVPIAPWQDETFFRDMRRSQRPNAYLRMAENRFVTSESSFIDLADWDVCCDTDVRPLIEAKDLPVWIGVDASAKHDTTAIVAVTYANQRVRLVAHRIFVPTKYDPINFEQAVEATLLDFAKRFAVRKVMFDPWQMIAVSQSLEKKGLHITEFPQTSPNLTLASQNLYDLVVGRNLLMYPNADIRLAVSRAVAIETSRGWRIAKEKQSHKVDVVVALAMAAYAAVMSAREPAEPPIVMPYAWSKTSGTIVDPADLAALRREPPPAEQQAAPPTGATSPQPPLLPKDAPIPASYLKDGQRREPWSGFIRDAGYFDGMQQSIWDPRWSPPRNF